MPYITGDYRYLHKNYHPIFCAITCLIIFLLTSCDKKSHTSAPDLSAIFDNTNSIYDTNPTRAIRYMDSAMAKQKNVSIPDQVEYYRMHFYYNDQNTKDYNKALLYTDSMQNLIEVTQSEKKYAKQYSVAAFSKGDVLFKMGKFSDAYRCYYQGKKIGSSSFDSCTMGEYSYHMGMIMYKQEHYKQAASHFIQSFNESKTCTDNFATFYRNQELLDNAALSYHRAGMLSEAESYYQRTLEYIKTEGAKYSSKTRIMEVSLSVVYGNLAGLYLEKNNFAKAEPLLKKSIETNLKKGNDNRDAELTELKLAHLYIDAHKPALLYNLLKNIRAQLDSVKNIDAEVDWNYLMADYYKKTNDLKKALYYFDAYDEIKDSVTNANRKLKESDFNQQFKDLEDQSTIKTLRSDNKVQHMYLIVALVYAIMALIIILLIFLNWRRSKNSVKTLSDLNKKVNEQKLQLEKSLAELEKNGHEKDRILRAVSHDLRNPIGGIASLTAMMLMEEGLDSEQIELLNLIQATTNNSLELINEILEATTTLSAKTLNKQYVDINVLLTHSVELLRFKAAEKNQKIMLDVLEDPEELYISREKIWRVLSNLISNAIKFSPNGAVITVKVFLENDNIKISVNDHGIGIPDKIKDQVFHMFTEAKRPGTLGEKSFGLGLSISKQIVESHNGEIWFDSDPSNGTTFYVRLKKQPAKKNRLKLL